MLENSLKDGVFEKDSQKMAEFKKIANFGAPYSYYIAPYSYYIAPYSYYIAPYSYYTV